MQNKLRACVHTPGLGTHISEVRIAINLVIVLLIFICFLFRLLLIVHSLTSSEVTFHTNFHMVWRIVSNDCLPWLRLLLGPKVGQAMHQHYQHVTLFFDYMNYKANKGTL